MSMYPTFESAIERIAELEGNAEARERTHEREYNAEIAAHQKARTTNKKLREALERIRRMKNARPDDIQGAAWRNGWNDAVCEVRTIALAALKEEEEE